MPLKVIRACRADEAEDGLVELEAECRFTALGESSSAQPKIFSIETSKIEKALKESPLSSFSLQIIVKKSVLKDILKKVGG